MNRRLRYISFVVAVSIFILILKLNASFILEVIAINKLEKIGAKNVTLQIAETGLSEITIQSLGLVLEGGTHRYDLDARNINVSYSFPEVLAGNIQKLSAENMAIDIKSLNIAREEDNEIHLADVYQSVSGAIKNSPVDFIELMQIKLNYETGMTQHEHVMINGYVSASKERVLGRVEIDSEVFKTNILDFDLNVTGTSTVKVTKQGASPDTPYIKAQANTIHVDDAGMRGEFAVDIDIGTVQAIMKALGIEPVNGNIQGRLHTEGPFRIPFTTDEVHETAPWWEANTRLSLSSASIENIGDEIEALIPVRLTLYKEKLTWRFTQQATVSGYPEVEKIDHKDVKAATEKHGRQRMLMTFPVGSQGELMFEGGGFTIATPNKQEVLRLMYGDKAPEFSADVIIKSMQIKTRPQLNVRLETDHQFRLASISPIPTNRVEFVGKGTIELVDKQLKVQLAPSSTFTLGRINQGKSVINSVSAELINQAGCYYTREAGRWSCLPFSLHMNVSGINHQSLHLNNMIVKAGIEALNGNQKKWVLKLNCESPDWLIKIAHDRDERFIKLDQVSALLSASNEALHTEISIQAGNKAAQLDMVASHSLRAGYGNLDYVLAPLLFEQNASEIMAIYDAWPDNIFINGGQIKAKGEISWRRAANDSAAYTLQQHSEVALKSLSGVYDEIPFTGVDSHFVLSGIEPMKIESVPAIKIEKLDPGTPIKDVHLVVKSMLEKGRSPIMNIPELSMRVLDGNVTGKEIEIDLNRAENPFNLQISNINVEALLALEQQEGLYGTGLIDGNLPLVLTDKGIFMQGGKIEARQPGGKLRYTPDERIKGMAVSNKGLELLVKAMEDFNYNVLSAKADYTPDGSLKMKVELKGHNPELENGRPVHLNVDIEDNILALMRSLRLAGEISETISDKVQQRKQGN